MQIKLTDLTHINQNTSEAWSVAECNHIGKRSENQDVLRYFAIIPPHERKAIICLIACDGVGGLPNGLECAEALADTVYSKMLNLVKTQRFKLFYKRNHAVRNTIAKQSNKRRKKIGASTFVMELISLKRNKDGYRSIILWAGDSRGYYLDENLSLQQLTQDNTDTRGALTSYYNHQTGFINGISETRFSCKKAPVLFGVTTDGFHGKCSKEELESFILWYLQNHNNLDQSFSYYCEAFIKENISDNFSALFFLKRSYHGIQLS